MSSFFNMFLSFAYNQKYDQKKMIIKIDMQIYNNYPNKQKYGQSISLLKAGF